MLGAASGALLWRGTDGFRALTTEQARRLAIAREPRPVPEIALEDQDGRVFTLAEYRGRPVVLDFVYTQCASVCPLLSVGFQRLEMEGRGRAPRLELLSISFDPRDTPGHLRAYAARYGADGERWRFARVRKSGDLAALLRAFDVVVIPDGRGDFQHNAAVLVVDAQGRFNRVLDPGATLGEIDRALGGERRLAVKP
ncbi:MAG: SCO family protein [Gemmatimonadaceae bacterium]